MKQRLKQKGRTICLWYMTRVFAKGMCDSPSYKGEKYDRKVDGGAHRKKRYSVQGVVVFCFSGPLLI